MDDELKAALDEEVEEVEEFEEFDPLAPIAFDDDDENDGKGEEQNYFVDKVPAIAPSVEEAAAERRAKYPVPEPTPAERIAKALKGMPGQKKLLLHVIGFCREEREDAQIVAEITSFERGGVNVYSPESLVAILARCGAIRQTNAPAPEEGRAPQEGDGGAEQAQAAAQAQAAPGGEAPAADAAATSGEQAPAPGKQVAAPGTDAAPGEQAPAPEEPPAAPDETPELDDGATLQVSKPEPARYIATEEGLEAVAAEDPAARFRSFMDANPVYAPVFRTVLEACSDEGGATKKQIDALVDHDPVCREPRRFSGYFVDKLEDADAIVFEGAWRITDAGRAMLEEDGVIGALC